MLFVSYIQTHSASLQEAGKMMGHSIQMMAISTGLHVWAWLVQLVWRPMAPNPISTGQLQMQV